MSDGREWGVGLSPSWASNSVPNPNSPSNSLLSLIPKELNHQPVKANHTRQQGKTTSPSSYQNKTSLDKSRGSLRHNHHDSRIRRWQSRKPPDAKGDFGQITSSFSKSLRTIPDQSIINYHRDLRIAALVKQSVKEQSKNKKEIEESDENIENLKDAEAAEMRAFNIRQRFAKRNFHQWGSAVLRAVLEGDKEALEMALNAEGVDVDEVVVDAVFEDDNDDASVHSPKLEGLTLDSDSDSDSEDDSAKNKSKKNKKQGKFGNFVLDRSGCEEAAVIAGNLRRIQLGLRCPNPTSKQMHEAIVKQRQEQESAHKKLAHVAKLNASRQLAAASQVLDGSSMHGGGGGGNSGASSVPDSPIPTERAKEDDNFNNSSTLNNGLSLKIGSDGGGGGGGTSSGMPSPLRNSPSDFEGGFSDNAKLLGSTFNRRIIEKNAIKKLWVPHLTDCDYYIPPITDDLNVFEQDHANKKRGSKTDSLDSFQIDNRKSFASGRDSLFGDGDDESSYDSCSTFSKPQPVGLFICRGDSLLHIILRNVHVGYGKKGGIHALAEVALKRGCTWAVRNDKGLRPSDIAAQPVGDKSWGASFCHSLKNVSTVEGSLSQAPGSTAASRNITRKRLVDFGKREAGLGGGVLVSSRPNGLMKWYNTPA